ncbi:uncharacterized protein LOC123316821 [Coccinella septempunctata]|uniref:uncharacterized protein LOC123316821 n=1 Tax=Coccinella septempunctata TaxID=41139 RepID=UPI001D05EE6D|nr:uncharacterized protein LOC123316821 [Coccinella septempunctata]
MKTILHLIIVSALSFVLNGHSEHSQSAITSTFSDHNVNDLLHRKEFQPFSGLDKACSNENEKALYNHLTREGDQDSSIESITIGFLGAYGSTQVVLGALPLAVEAVNKDAGMK